MVSALSFGTWVTFGDQVQEDTARACMIAAREAGVNFFDTAEVYAQGRAEEMMGAIIEKEGWKRSDLVIATKIFWGGKGPNDSGLSRKHIMEGMDASLDRMHLDYADLVYCHRPDTRTPIEETVWAMSDLVRNGLAFYWGTSEWSAQQIMEAWAIARREHLVPPAMEQPQYNMFTRDRVEHEYARLYEEVGLGTTIWSPLAGGLLTGKYNRISVAASRLRRGRGEGPGRQGGKTLGGREGSRLHHGPARRGLVLEEPAGQHRYSRRIQGRATHRESRCSGTRSAFGRRGDGADRRDPRQQAGHGAGLAVALRRHVCV
jgi:aryl-alcohol dehydrogenase-like predicted oxidoreductase